MVLYKSLLIIAAYAVAAVHCEDCSVSRCVFNLKHKEKHLQFDLTRFLSYFYS